MSHAILSQDTRQHLEREKERLLSDRQKIVSLVSAKVDETIQHLNVLLEDATIVTAPVPELELSEQAESDATLNPAPTPRKAGAKKASKPQAKAKPTQAPSFDAKQLKRKFKGIGVSDAIVQIMQQDASQIYAADDLIAALYDNFDDADLSKARKTLGAVLMHTVRAGKIEKVQDKPSRYKLGEPVAISA